MKMEFKKGMKVLYNKEMACLTFSVDKNGVKIPFKEKFVGVIDSVHKDFLTIVYPENAGHEFVNGKWELIKGKPLLVYAHSANFNDCIIIP